MQLLSVEGLEKRFFITGNGFRKKRKIVHAVNGVNLSVEEGDIFGIVGESGSGKSTLGRCILRLIEPTDGDIFFEGVDLRSLKGEKLRDIRKRMQMVFQDSYTSLNPRVPVGSAIEEPLKYVEKELSKSERKERVYQLLSEVGLDESHYYNYPMQFSGGQRQRIGIARALSLNPRLLIADEPVSALDVSVQAQIINLFVKLQETRNLTYIFISHDLSVVKHLCNKIAVMYLGEIVETASCDELFDNPLHPYTKALISAIPEVKTDRTQKRIILQGDIPSPTELPAGCKFHTRCPSCMNICKYIAPHMSGSKEHQVMCHL